MQSMGTGLRSEEHECHHAAVDSHPTLYVLWGDRVIQNLVWNAPSSRKLRRCKPNDSGKEREWLKVPGSTVQASPEATSCSYSGKSGVNGLMLAYGMGCSTLGSAQQVLARCAVYSGLVCDSG